jgi:hypothetical protein
MKMKGMNLRNAVLAAVVTLAMAQSAVAASVTFYRINGYYSGQGGEFTAIGTPYVGHYDPLATATHPTHGVGFQTFCLELDERLQMGVTYDYTIDSWAIEGGVGGPSPDPLSYGTAWLYSQFARGTLADYDYDPNAGRSSSAAELQEAFWWLEDELDLADPYNDNIFVKAVIDQFGSADAAKADAPAGYNNVWVLNPMTAAGQPRQSVLVLVPDGGLTLMMLGASVLGFAALRRRLRR